MLKKFEVEENGKKVNYEVWTNNSCLTNSIKVEEETKGREINLNYFDHENWTISITNYNVRDIHSITLYRMNMKTIYKNDILATKEEQLKAEELFEKYFGTVQKLLREERYKNIETIKILIEKVDDKTEIKELKNAKLIDGNGFTVNEKDIIKIDPEIGLLNYATGFVISEESEKIVPVYLNPVNKNKISKCTEPTFYKKLLNKMLFDIKKLI